MAGEVIITVIGNLVDDPELRFTPAGAAVAKFRLASTPRTFDKQTNQWQDGESLFLSCSVWRQAAENVAESLQKGMRVIVQGRLKQRSYEDRESVKRTVYELDVEELGPSLRSATAKVTKASGSSSGQGQRDTRQASRQGASGGPADDPWSSGSGGGQSGGGQSGAWGGGGGQGGWSDDAPPF